MPLQLIAHDRRPRTLPIRAFLAGIAAFAAFAAAGVARAEDADDVRGVETRARTTADVAREAADAVLFLPRLAVQGVLYSSGFGIEATQDARFVARTKDLLLFLDRGGIYPRVAFSSESFPALGANLFYRGSRFGVVGGGAYSNDEFWVGSTHLSWQGPIGSRVLKVTVSGRVELEDDRVFYGIGAHPRSDPRSAFLAGTTQDEGRYLQRRGDVDAVVALRAASRLELFLDARYRTRRPENPTDGGDRFGDVFDLAALPGARELGRQVYTELSGRYDTRPYPGVLSPGFRAQAYAGVSTGVGDDRSRLFGSGVDASAYLPVLLRNRLLVVRGVLDMVENLRDAVPIPFTEYPRHLTFRGVSSSRTILRTDEWVLVPSVAYQWPLTDNLSSQLFVDGLLVARQVEELSLGGAPWAAGLALEVHTRHHGLGRLVVGGGSEGARIGVDLGSPITDNDRSGWN